MSRESGQGCVLIHASCTKVSGRDVMLSCKLVSLAMVVRNGLCVHSLAFAYKPCH